MSVLAFNPFERFLTDVILGGNGSTPAVPSPWKMALSTTAVSTMARNSVWSATVSGTNINEIGSTTPAFYSRQDVNRDQTANGWPAGTVDVVSPLSYKATGKQVTFGAFTGSGPTPNGCNSFVMTDGVTLNAGAVYIAGDTGSTITFLVGDQEKVQATVKNYSV